VSTTTQNLSVTGMTCSGCVNAVTRVLSHVPGVTDVHVTLETGSAKVAGTASPGVLVAALRKAGYGAEALRA